MIRISDLAAAAAWARPAASSTRSDSLQDPSSWFDHDPACADVRLSSDLPPGSRGLTVEQHAGRVLAFLCGDRDRDA